MSWNRVETVEDYWDGPLRGYAFMDGELVFYDCIWSEEEDAYSDQFLVKPVSADLLVIVRESWSIWQRWEQAFLQIKQQETLIPHYPLTRKEN